MLTATNAKSVLPLTAEVLAQQIDSTVQDVAAKYIVHWGCPGTVSDCELDSGYRPPPYSLAGGSAGFAIFFDHLDRCYPNRGWDRFAKLELQKASTAFAEASCATALFDGSAGLAFATWYLSRGGQRYRSLTASLDAAILPQLNTTVQVSPDGGVPTGYFDVVSGLSGVCAYLLCRTGDPACSSALKHGLASLIWLAQPVAPLPRWHTPASCVVGTLARAYPGGFLDCGLAHGVAGPLAVMALAQAQEVDAPGLESGIEAIADWLIAQTVFDDWGPNWPAAVPLEGVGRSVPASRPPAFSKEKPTKTAWCYGAPGVANALWLAGYAMRRPEWIDRSIDAMVAAISKPRAKRYINSYAHICHGLAGLLLITHLFHQRTGADVFRSAVHQLTEELISLFDPGAIAGFTLVEFDSTRRPEFGLLEGATGAALALLAIKGGEPPTWLRMFALS